MTWFRELRMGFGFAVTGGREGWTRTLLTAVGVGLGVALLLLTTAIPDALSAREKRDRGRDDASMSSTKPPAAANTLLVGRADSQYKQTKIRGRLLRAEGPQAPVPPGLTKIPAPGEIVVSPALADLLASGEGRLLKERFPYRTVGRIGDAGLLGPDELAYYAGSNSLAPDSLNVERISRFGNDRVSDPYGPRLLLLVIFMFVALLTPVAVFIATAVRFGGERRDRRLAALRLVGADARTVRRIAAGEALAGSLVGLLLGALFFLGGRQLAPLGSMFDLSVFPADLDPSLPLLALVLLVVPAASVAVTMLPLRGVVIEPLGVVRTATPVRRRLWWRLLVPLAGVAVLAPMMRRGTDHGDFNEVQVVGGTVLLLVGVTAMLPWLVEAVVGRLGGGGLPWQLAVRRLQVGSGAAARSVNGIAVAVAGAIALQMLFGGVEGDYVISTGQNPDRAQMSVMAQTKIGSDRIEAITQGLKETKGVRGATAYATTSMADAPENARFSASLTIGTCEALRELAGIERCAEGDTFVLAGPDPESNSLVRPGSKVFIDPKHGMHNENGKATPWQIPAGVKPATPRGDAAGRKYHGVLTTPSTLPAGAAGSVSYSVDVRLDPAVSDARDRVRNTAGRIDPLLDVFDLSETEVNKRFANVRNGLLIGTTAVLLLIGVSLLVSTLEQLRERRKLLSVLVAFGTKRTTLSWSILWQTAVPVVLGLVLAVCTGVGLGAVLLKMVGRPVALDWTSMASMTGIGAGVVLLVTALSLPPLWRMMRPDGLRTE
ncbi:ABC transporter permease [Embleya sp. NBC_00888]|uniref:FtsX-like permease family protein n=1 Tax=Embleya sp. NBC_00888 TaxID=2975960 RepID=UPI0038643E32|nr:ABC transporter permease [Embleya sp. NBC_00888]